MNEKEFEKVLTLSEREHEVFVAIGHGKTTKDIAATPGHVCSVKTVDTHKTHIKAKLGLENATGLYYIAVRYVAFMEMNRIQREARPIIETAPFRFVRSAA